MLWTEKPKEKRALAGLRKKVALTADGQAKVDRVWKAYDDAPSDMIDPPELPVGGVQIQNPMALHCWPKPLLSPLPSAPSGSNGTRKRKLTSQPASWRRVFFLSFGRNVSPESAVVMSAADWVVEELTISRRGRA